MLLHLKYLLFFVCALPVIWGLSTVSLAVPTQIEIAEDEAKAVLLYNFIKHTRWPKQAKSDGVSVAFLEGDQAFFKAFKRIADEAEVRNRPIRLSLIKNYKKAAGFNVLVVPKPYNNHLDLLASSLTRTNTLLITDNAHDRSLVMINFIQLKSNKISFEVNRSNIAFEQLGVSKDVLLYGGSEIEVATLYKEMEKRLINSKALLISQEATIQQQQDVLNDQAAKINEKTQYIERQQSAIKTLNKEQADIQSLLDVSGEHLSSSRQHVAQVQKRLYDSRELSLQLSEKIKANAAILSKQKSQIDLQEEKISTQIERLGEQEDTISSQRNVIVIALCALLLVTLYIILRQMRALIKERAISVEKTRLVKYQEESIDAYKSSLQVKDDFLSAINHGLRTPMHLIMGALHDISVDDKKSLQNSLNIVEDGAEQMMQLISDILFYSEIQSNQVQLNASSVKIKYQLIEACEQYKMDAEDKKLNFKLNFASRVPDYLHVDVERLCIVVEKVLDNAVKYTKNGKISVNVDWKVVQGPQLIIHIDDTGIGFSPSELEEAFKPFEQPSTQTPRKQSGLGIGLSICEKLISIMGGSIKIDSDGKSGSSVCLSLPAPQAILDKQGKETVQLTAVKSKSFIKPVTEVKSPGFIKAVTSIQSVSPSSKDPLSEIKATTLGKNTETKPSITPSLRLAVDNLSPPPMILIVEEDAASQVVLEKNFSAQGYRYQIVSSGIDVLEAIAEHRPSLVMMGVEMGNMDGVDYTRSYRESTNRHQPPIVGLMANYDESMRKDCLAAGMDAVLSKPIDISRASDVIGRLLSTYNAKTMDF